MSSSTDIAIEPALVEELYTFLRQADARELDLLFTPERHAVLFSPSAR